MSEPPTFEVQGRAGEPIALPVGGTAATGHEWTLAGPPEVELIGETDAAPETTGPAGAPTQHRLVVTAPPGRYELTARLARPWEDEPVRTVRIDMVVSE